MPKANMDRTNAEAATRKHMPPIAPTSADLLEIFIGGAEILAMEVTKPPTSRKPDFVKVYSVACTMKMALDEWCKQADILINATIQASEIVDSLKETPSDKA